MRERVIRYCRAAGWGGISLAVALGPYPAWGEGMGKASKGEDLPLSKEDLFGMAPQEGKGAAAKPEVLPDSKDDLFGLDSGRDKAVLPDSKEALFADVPKAQPEKAMKLADGPSPVRGFFQAELARTVSDPEHWSKVMGRLELGTQGRFGQGVRWKLGGRVDYNAVYDLADFYQSQVRDDQRAEFHVRETYLDFAAGGWDWRLGRQHIVWGEMVGLFFADVVSAKDLREFVLPDFQVLRIPQWAARAEYFVDDFHAEAIWIPFPSYDQIGKPQGAGPGRGADFYPYPLPVPMLILGEDKPSTSLDHGNVGLRLSQLKNGWDLSGFYYSSMSSAPTFYQYTPGVLTPRHDRIWQLGGTLAKDFRDVVLKAEVVYSAGRRFNLTNVVAPDPAGGVVKQNTLDWALGLDFNPASDTRVNAQLFQRYFFDHNPNIIPDRAENGFSLLVSHDFQNDWKAEALLVHSLNRQDWMLRPKVTWGFRPNWRLSMGVDLFEGPVTGLFGQYDAQDRAYAEVRYDF